MSPDFIVAPSPFACSRCRLAAVKVHIFALFDSVIQIMNENLDLWDHLDRDAEIAADSSVFPWSRDMEFNLEYDGKQKLVELFLVYMDWWDVSLKTKRGKQVIAAVRAEFMPMVAQNGPNLVPNQNTEVASRYTSRFRW